MLNPGKCKWSIHDLIPKEDGTWEYRRCKLQLSTIKEGEVYPGTVQVEQREGEDDSIDALRMTVPQASGPEVVFTQLQLCQAMKDLGLYTPPEGSSDPHLEAKQDRVDDWTSKMRAGSLPARSAWLSYKCQLWGGLKYGLGASPAKLEELKNGLGKSDHKILSMLGICRNINTQWRYLPHCYRGMELHNLPIETTAASINSFLQHYGTKTNLGLYLTALIENLQLELGVSRCSFEYDYDTWNELATDSWVKLLWERVRNFDIQLEADYKPLTMPREYDECIMERFVNEGVKGHELVAINRVTKYQ